MLIIAIVPIAAIAAPKPNPKSSVEKTLAERLKEKEKKVKELKAQQDKLRKQLQDITLKYQDSYTKLILIKERVQRNQQKLDETSIELDLNQSKLNDRVTAMYKKREDILLLELLLNISSFEEFLSNLNFLNRIGNADKDLVTETKTLKIQVEQKQAVLEKEKARQQITLDDVQTKQNDMKRNLDAQHMLEKLISADVVRLRQQTTNINGLELSIVFPVNGPHSFINDWGFPRSGGRTHKGTDIFAAKGTPAVSTTDGIIGKMSRVEKGLGGITLSVFGIDNMQYYYAHLDSIVPNLNVGDRVSAGQLVGYVGNTGNARTTPPHVHFGIYPGGGDAINPYPYLMASDPYRK